MNYITSKEFTRLSKLLDILHEFLPDFGVDIKSKEKGWDLFVNINSPYEPLTYKFYLSYDSIIKYEPRYIAEMIYDQIALGYTE